MKYKMDLEDLGGDPGCTLSDVIYVPLNPTQVESLARLFKRRVLAAEDYSAIKEENVYAGLFYDAFDEWIARRHEKDNNGGGLE